MIQMHQLRRAFRLASVSVVALAAVVLIAVPSHAEVYPRSLILSEVYRSLNHRGMLISDFDGDGDPEFLEEKSDGREFCIREFSAEKFLANCWLHHGESDPNVIMTKLVACNLDGKVGDELISMMQDVAGDSVWIRVTSLKSKRSQVICRTKAIIGNDINDRRSSWAPNWDGTIDQCYFADLNSDGEKELIAVCAVGYDCYPRGIFVYDFRSGELLWKFQVPANIAQVEFADADGDGKPEVYFKSNAMGNYCQVRNERDTVEYIYALDYDGDSLWAENTGGRMDFHSTRFAIDDVLHDGTLQMYSTELLDEESGFDEHVTKLKLADLRTRRHIAQHSFDPKDSFGDLIVADLDMDGRCEVILDNGPTVLDGRTLEPIAEGSYKPWRLSLVDNVDGDSTNGLEVVITRADTLVILDRNMNERVRYAADGYDAIAKLAHFAVPNQGNYLGMLSERKISECHGEDILVLKVDAYTAQAEIFSISDWLSPSWFGVVVGVLLGAVASILFLKINGRVRSKVKTREPAGEFDSLLDSLATFEHGQSAGRNLERLEFLLSNLPDSEDRLKQILPRVMSALETYSSFTSGQLRDVVSRSARFDDFASEADRIRVLDTELSDIISEIRASETADSLRSSKERLSDLAARLKESVREIRRQVMSKLSVDLLGAVNAVTGSLSAQLRQSGIAITKLDVRGDISRQVFFSRSHLVPIVEELVANASEAMKDSSIKNISVAISIASDTATLAISDTGRGIVEKNTEMLFDRDYSTKADRGGYGLFYIRQQLERFGGKISICNNEESAGATVTLTIRLVPDD